MSRCTETKLGTGTHTHTYLFASSLSTCHIPCDLTTYFFRYLCLLFHLREIITLYYNNALGKKERRKKKEEIIKSCKVSFASKMIVMSSLPLTRSLCYQEEISWEIKRSKDNTLTIHKSLNRKQAYFLWCAFTGKFRILPLLFSASWKQSSH